MSESLKRRKLDQNHHPYGVQPLGNYYARPTTTKHPLTKRNAGLGDLSVLDDQLVLGILSLLQAKDLLLLNQVSPSMYVFSNLDELWRFLVLEESAGNFRYHPSGSWRATYLHKLSPNTLHTPLQISDMYSDHMFTSWLNRVRPFSSHWLSNESVSRENASNLSVERFISEYEQKLVPVVISGALDEWKGSEKWSLEYLRDTWGDVSVQVQTVDMLLRDYYEYAKHSNDETSLYLFDHKFVEKCKGIENDFEVPKYFTEDLFNLLGEIRPRYRWLIAGPARSGSTFHKDPNGTSAWNACVSGSKKWIFFPPNVTPPGVFLTEGDAEVAVPTSTFEWYAQFYEDARDLGSGLECVARAGDLVFVPSGWWHMVVNLEDSVAVTQNYVGRTNVRQVLRFLCLSPEQVSGYACDRDLYVDFRQALVDDGWSEEELDAMVEEKQSMWSTLKSTSSFSFL